MKKAEIRTVKKAEKRLTRLQVMLSRSELTVLDNFQLPKRMPSRAAAIREILLRGLSVVGFEIANQDTRSTSFGVIATDP